MLMQKGVAVGKWELSMATLNRSKRIPGKDEGRRVKMLVHGDNYTTVSLFAVL